MPSLALQDEKTSPDDEEKQLATAQANSAPVSGHGGTLLPPPIASLISAGTGIGSFSVRAGTKVAGWGLFAGREATLKSLSVTRNVAESVLWLAGRDVASRSVSEIGEQEAASIMKRSLDLLHTTISTASFITTSGFYLTELTLNSFSGMSIKTLSMLNAILGSTESSKAVASVIKLLTNELNKPEAGEVLRYFDILYAVVSFVLLQRWGRRKTQLEFRNAGGEETIWDAVIDDKGFRADVVGTRRQQIITLNSGHAPPGMTFAPVQADDDIDPLERGTLFDDQQFVVGEDGQLALSDDEIYARIISQVPKEATVNITTETIQAKTIKVNIRHSETAHIDAPPGTVMVAERLNHDHATDAPSQTIIFRTALKRTSSAERGPDDDLRLTSLQEPVEVADTEDIVMMDVRGPSSSPTTKHPQYKGLSEESDQERLDHEADTSGPTTGALANQKKSRKPVFGRSTSATSRIPLPKSPKEKTVPTLMQDKGNRIKKALKTLTPTSSVTAMKDAQNVLPKRRVDAGKPLPQIPRFTPASSHITLPRIYPTSSRSNGHSPLASPHMTQSPQQIASSSYFSVQHSRRDSTISQTDTYSVHSESRPGSRPGSPTFVRSQTRTVNGIPKTKSEVGLSAHDVEPRLDSSSNSHHHHHHQRTRSFVPSLYSMASRHSGEAVVLQPRRPAPRKSIYEDSKMIDTLMAEGKVPGTFPDRHLARTVRRFARFATASYGSGFLQFFGLNKEGKPPSKSKELMAMDIHHEHSSFSTYTGLPADTIILSSFYDPQGMTGNLQWSTSAVSPLIHFISLDHESKAVVLTCRGTLGFEDILTDMACDFDDIVWQGHSYKVHRGIHASARRMLGGSGSRVMATIKSTLEEYKEYGLVLCGHSLGGAVAALVAILISEPGNNTTSQSFVTSASPKLLTDSSSPHSDLDTPVALPAGRPIHVYSYGSPATVSEPLRLVTRGLITTVVNASDIMPALSLGSLHDFRTIALYLKNDSSDAYSELRSRIWRRIRNWVQFDAATFPSGPPPPEDMAGDGIGEDAWAWFMLQSLRDKMVNFKPVPPGEVFILETTRVFDRLHVDVKQEAMFGSDINDDNKTEKMYRALGRPATRVQFKWVRDVEKRFSELRFGRDMFGDHSPGRYEMALGMLEAGVCEE